MADNETPAEKTKTPEETLDDLLAPRPKEFLQSIVRDYLASAIFFSSQIREPNLLPMVFMPVAFGALSFSVPKPEIPPQPAQPQNRPVCPAWDPSPKLATKTLKERKAAVKDAQDHLEEVEYKRRWDDASDDDVIQARARLLECQDALANLPYWEACLKEHVQKRKAYLADLQAYRKSLSVWRQAMRDWKSQCDSLQPQIEAWEARRQAYYKRLDEELGVIYAPMSDMMPRGVNGYPMFFSMAVLNKTDFNRVCVAIERELSRQKDLDV
jgi:hypothetical protein